MTVRTRFAPSPTGSLHVGGARTALYCLLFARHHDGTFVLRIEDTDQARSTEESRLGILRDLRWLRLQWDEGPEVGGEHGPYLQSQRLDTYNAAIDRLKADDRVFEAFESRDELGALRAEARANKRNFHYKRRTYTSDELERFRAEGREPVLRFQAPDREITVNDAILGPVSQLASEIEDMVVLKTDGFPTYHFAVVVDDADMRITHVMRGQEHLMNTHRHIGLMEALDVEPPTFAHMPTIDNMSGSKMSKRDKAKAAREGSRQWLAQQGAAKGDYAPLATAADVPMDVLTAFMKKKSDDVALATKLARFAGIELPMIEVADFRERGYLPEALTNFLALLGWSPGDDREIMSTAEMAQLFTLDRVGKTSAKFDVQKLTWMNGEYIRHATTERLLLAIDEWLEVYDSPLAGATTAQRTALVGMYRERMKTLVDLDIAARFFFARPDGYDAKAVKKHIHKGGGYERLAPIRDAIAAIDDWTAPGIHAALAAFAEANELGLGKVAQPLRIAVSGAGVTPGIDETLAFFDKAEVLARIDAAIEGLAP